ncbi:polyprotein [Phytophthora megakarya]|uniref:Polyprotein n=1 Tax=Phytophthora megakarya TaxID=4795 RepID=A0A225UW70_9STRA|nr:polyprotein [Phytophthora megakarya]
MTFTHYFRHDIPGCAGISAPIERLKLKGDAFVWTDDCEAALLQLKRRLIEPPILIYPDFAKRFKLYVDSSKLAVGACLMQTVDGRDRVVAYASKLLVGSEKNWIHKQDGTSKIECWVIVWTTRNFRCYLDRQEFDLFTDHKALTWVFNENNRTTNAKLARWAMELSQLRFKVFHKAGTLMGHVDGLSRLHTTAIAPVTMADLLNDSNSDSDSQVQVRERMLTMTDLLNDSGSNTDGSTQVRESDHAVDDDSCLVPTPGLIEVREHESVVDLPDSVPDGVPDERPQSTPGDVRVLDEVVEAQVSSPVDEFGLDRFRFIEEQKRAPWILALIAFLEDRALPIDGQLRVSVLQMALHYAVKNGILMRRVHLRARAGPARTTLVPVIPLPFIETVLHYCHADLLSSHSGTTKTIDKVRKHAYWHGWKRGVVEYVRACHVCGSGKGYRPWKNGLMQRMPVQDLSGPFPLVVVDVIGPLVTTPHGNKYILVFADYFTLWVEAFPVKKLDTITFVNLMVDEVVSRHGVPERLLSDRGPNFISNLAMSFYQTLGIKKLFGAAYHPQTQGLVERFNGTLLGMLRMFCCSLTVLRITKRWGDSPFFNLYRRDPILPLDLAFLNASPEWKSNEVAAYRRKLFLSMRDSRRMVQRQLLKAQSRHERRLEGQEAVTFAEGDAVWIYQYFRAKRGERKTKKLAFSWHGPYRVVGRLGENAYRIAIPTHPDRVVTVNVNRMKKFKGRMSRPFPTEVPTGVETHAGVDDDGSSK